MGERLVLVDPVLSRLEKERGGRFAPFVLAVPTAVTVPDTGGALHGQPGQPPGPLAPTSTSPGPARDEINARLGTILDRPERRRAAGDDEPVVGPPIYGQWLAAVRSVGDAPPAADGTPTPPPAPGWLRDLNLDPETRAAAGVGTTAVQRDQEPLMASAWDQLEAVVRANRMARWGQLFGAASGSMHTRRVEPRTELGAVRLARPALARLREGDGPGEGPTVAARLTRTPMPAALLGPAFARATRYAARVTDGLSTGDVFASVGPGLLDGTRHLRTRFDGPLPRLDAAAFGGLLKAAGAEDNIRAATGHPIDDHVARLGRLPELLAETVPDIVVDPGDLVAAGPVAGAGPAEGAGPAAGAGPAEGAVPISHVIGQVVVGMGAHEQVVAAPGGLGQIIAGQGMHPHLVAGAGALHAAAGTGVIGQPAGLVGQVHALGAAGFVAHAQAAGAAGVTPVAAHVHEGGAFGLEVHGDQQVAFAKLAAAAAGKLADEPGAAPVAVVAELQAMAGAPAGAAARLSPSAVSVLAGLVATGAIDADPVGAAGLAGAGGVRVVLARDHVAAFAAIAGAGNVAAEQVSTAIRAEAARSVVLSGFGIAAPVVPPLMIGLPADTVAAIVGRVDADLPAVALPAALREPPILEPIAAVVAHRLVADRLRPGPNYERMLDFHLRITPGAARRRSPSDQVMAAPRFPEPFLDRVREVDQEWVLGGAASIPPDSLMLMGDNRRFVEAALAGANHEMARELLWRGYPTDQRGTSFARFWPIGGTGGGAVAAGDIAPIPDWTNGLGLNPPGLGRVDDLTILVVKGQLLRRYPETIVSAIAGRAGGGDDPGFTPGHRPPVTERFRFPLAPDITCVGLAIPPDELKSAPAEGEAWFIALTQPIDQPRFGLDEAADPGAPAGPDDLAWPLVEAAVRNRHLGFRAAVPPVWAGDGADAATVADALFQRPFQLLLLAAEVLP